jgi:hypothetical protein
MTWRKRPVTFGSSNVVHGTIVSLGVIVIVVSLVVVVVALVIVIVALVVVIVVLVVVVVALVVVAAHQLVIIVVTALGLSTAGLAKRVEHHPDSLHHK